MNVNTENFHSAMHVVAHFEQATQESVEETAAAAETTASDAANQYSFCCSFHC